MTGVPISNTNSGKCTGMLDSVEVCSIPLVSRLFKVIYKFSIIIYHFNVKISNLEVKNNDLPFTASK